MAILFKALMPAVPAMVLGFKLVAIHHAGLIILVYQEHMPAISVKHGIHAVLAKIIGQPVFVYP